MIAMKRQRHPKVDLDMQAEIERLALKNWGATQIHTHLERQETLADRKLPTVRTVQRIVAGLSPRDSSGPWHIQDADSGEARLILDVLAAVVTETEGRKFQLTRAEADWTIRIRRAATNIPTWETWMAARFYMAREAAGEETADLDCLLAFDPWGGGEKAEQYFQAVRAGWIPIAPLPLIAPLADPQQHESTTPATLNRLRVRPEDAEEESRQSLSDAKTLQAFMRSVRGKSEEEDTGGTQKR